MNASSPRTIADYLPIIVPAALLVVFFVVPFGTMILKSFHENSGFGASEATFTLANYRRLLSPFFVGLLVATFGLAIGVAIIALFSAAFAVAIAFPIAWFNWRYRLSWVKVIITVGLAPFLLPPMITALGFLSLWTKTGFYGQYFTVIVSHGIFLVSLPLVSLTLGFSTLEPSLPEAAATMGADNRAILRTIVFPLVRPYLISGFAFAFVVSLNEYLVAYMTVGAVLETLQMRIFNSLRYGYTPVMSSASIFFVILTVVIFSLVARFGDLPKLLGAHRR